MLTKPSKIKLRYMPISRALRGSGLAIATAYGAVNAYLKER